MKAGSYKTSFCGMEYPVYYVQDINLAKGFIHKLLAQDDALYGLDTETQALPEFKYIASAGLIPQYSRVRLLQIFTGRTAFVFDMNYLPYELFTEFLNTKAFVGHNSLFDLQFLLKDFKANNINIGCTLLASKLIFHACSHTDEGLSASLRNLVNIAFKTDLKKEAQHSDFSELELTWEQVEYAALDAITVLLLANRLAPKLNRLGMSKVYNLYKAAQHPLAKMQLNGIGFNEKEHLKLVDEWKVKAEQAEKELLEKTKLDKITITTMGKWLEENLPTNILEVWPRSEVTQKLQTNADAFVLFSYLDIVKPFTKFQKSSKLYQSFGDGLSRSINKVTGRIHPRYNIAGARTGRLSCTNPNLQQSPKDQAFRELFIPSKDCVFVLADYSQIEVRVVAEVSGDKEMLQVYETGKDIYRHTASQLNKVPEEKVTKEQRQGAKALCLGLLYGLGAKKFGFYAKKNYGVDVSEEESVKAVKDYRRLYSGLRAWQNAQTKSVETTDFIVETALGKKRKLDPEHSFGASLNTPIQGSAAEILLCALVRLEQYSKIYPFSFIANIHDEIILECLPKHAKKIKAVLEKAMNDAFRDVFPNARATKNLVDAHIGNSWANAKG